jgi:D-arabinose 1-dehydrogenase-like Zn-dependent alcohol dehydrogenase
MHEAALIDRTKEACGGPVDIVINFGTTTRVLLRCLHCLTNGGTVMIGSESSEILMRKYKHHCEKNNQTIKSVHVGTFDQLKELVNLVVLGEVNICSIHYSCTVCVLGALNVFRLTFSQIDPPPYKIFPAENAANVLKMVARNEVNGRAILQFADIN